MVQMDTQTPAACGASEEAVSAPNPGAIKIWFSLFFCNLTYISHLYSAWNDRNKSKGIGGFLLLSLALWPKVQGGWDSSKGTSVVVYHQPTLATTKISSFLLGPQWSVLHWYFSVPNLRPLCPFPSSAPSMRYAGTRSHPEAPIPCWVMRDSGHLSQARVATYFSSKASLGCCLGKWPCSSSLRFCKLCRHSVITYSPWACLKWDRVGIIFLQIPKSYIHLALQSPESVSVCGGGKGRGGEGELIGVVPWLFVIRISFRSFVHNPHSFSSPWELGFWKSKAKNWLFPSIIPEALNRECPPCLSNVQEI